MTRSRVYLLVAILAVVAAVWWWRSGGGAAYDLVAEVPNAVEKRPRPEIFSVSDVTIAGVTKPSILVNESSRIKFRVTVPEHAWLEVDLGIQEKGWTMPGDGVHFLIGVGGPNVQWEELMQYTVNPFGNPSERTWHPISLDLSQYAGVTVELVFNTYSSPPPPPGHAPTDDRNGDFAVWGAPRVVMR
jgi:hypothetical protein